MESEYRTNLLREKDSKATLPHKFPFLRKYIAQGDSVHAKGKLYNQKENIEQAEIVEERPTTGPPEKAERVLKMIRKVLKVIL